MAVAEILPKRREKNGRLQRPSKKQMEAILRSREESEMAVVLAQPHRRGNRDQKCESALGRFCIRMKLREELHDAGKHYANITRLWRVAKGIPSQLVKGGIGSGNGPSDATVAEWSRKLSRVQTAMQRGTPEGYYAIRLLCLDNEDVEYLNEAQAVDALVIMAREFGYLSTGDVHPYLDERRNL